VKPVEDEIIDTTIPQLPRVVADMVRVHRLLGCRPGEVCRMRPCDINSRGEIWEHRPFKHKTDWRDEDLENVYQIGPQAQAILRP